MAQHDKNIANQNFPPVRADFNNALESEATLNSGPTEPTTTFPYMLWADTTDNVLKQRDAGDSVWKIRRTLDVDTVITKTTTYPVALADFGKTILCDATSGGFDIDLPAAATAGDGFWVVVKKIDSSVNLITIDGNGTETIDGDQTPDLDTQYESLIIACDGTSWHVEGDRSYKTKVSVADTTPDYLENLIASGSGITITKNNPGSNETLSISSDGSGFFTHSEVSLKTDNYPLVSTDKGKTMIMNSVTPKAFTFPDIVGGEIYIVKNIGTGLLTLTPHASDTIEIASIPTNGSFIVVGDENVNKWRVIAEKKGTIEKIYYKANLLEQTNYVIDSSKDWRDRWVEINGIIHHHAAGAERLIPGGAGDGNINQSIMNTGTSESLFLVNTTSGAINFRFNGFFYAQNGISDPAATAAFTNPAMMALDNSALPGSNFSSDVFFYVDSTNGYLKLHIGSYSGTLDGVIWAKIKELDAISF
jgi:hypothetical protein